MSPAARGPAGSPRPTVLVIDDDAHNLAIVSDYLAGRDYTLLAAEDGQSGLERAAYARPDLILLDVLMPGIDGFETCRRLKAQESTRDVPVIFMTALAETEHKVKGFDAGAVDYITKPFQREEVLARVGVHLRNRALTRELREANESLERRVEERTLELARANEELQEEIAERRRAEAVKESLEARLRQSEKMEALGTLVGGISHDFNNLLQAITGHTELLLRRKAESDPDFRHLSLVETAARRAVELVRRLLTFSRRSEVRAEPTDVNRIVEEVVGLLGRTIPKMIEFRVNLAPGLPEIVADAVQLEQVVLNLATNAVDAMGESGVLLVETEPFTVAPGREERFLELRPGAYVLLTVSDTGCGMDAKTRERVFEPFFTTKAPGKGTGLGLSTVYGIVKAHGGLVACYSEPGAGTTFKVYLPMGAAAGRPAPDAEAETGPPASGTETILVVDDEESLLDLVEETLSDQGYAVLRATSGEEALEVYARNPGTVALVVMDLGMPGKGGQLCLEELLAHDPDARVIVASGYSGHAIAQDPAAHGASAFLHKPYRLHELLAAVRTTLDGR